MGQYIADLSHQINAQIIIIDADMNVHPTDHQPANHLLQLISQYVIALFTGMFLFSATGKGMGRGRHQAEVMVSGNRCH